MFCLLNAQLTQNYLIMKMYESYTQQLRHSAVNMLLNLKYILI